MKFTLKKVKIYEHCEICKIDMPEGFEYYEIRMGYIDRLHRPQTRIAIHCVPCTEDLYPQQFKAKQQPLQQENLFGT